MNTYLLSIRKRDGTYALMMIEAPAELEARAQAASDPDVAEILCIVT